jgi:hypothetical protein
MVFSVIDARSYSIERCPIVGVIVPDQESWLYTKWRGFPQLLCYPCVCWVSGDAEMDHTARAQLDNDAHEQGAAQKIVCLQEVAGPYLSGVVAQEGPAVLLGRARRAHLLEVFSDCVRADAYTQFQ